MNFDLDIGPLDEKPCLLLNQTYSFPVDQAPLITGPLSSHWDLDRVCY